MRAPARVRSAALTSTIASWADSAANLTVQTENGLNVLLGRIPVPSLGGPLLDGQRLPVGVPAGLP